MNEITIKNLDGSTITIKTDCKSVNVNGQMFQFSDTIQPQSSDTIQPQKPIKFRIPYDSTKYIRIIKAIRTGTDLGLPDSKRIAENSGEFSVPPHLYDNFCRFINEAGIIVEMLDS